MGQWGSEASAGSPVVVLDGPATQLFDPVPSSPPPSGWDSGSPVRDGTMYSAASEVSSQRAVSGDYSLITRSAPLIWNSLPVSDHQKWRRIAMLSIGDQGGGS